MEQANLDLFGLIVAGGLSTYPLVLGSILALGVVIDRLSALRGSERAIARADRRLSEALAAGASDAELARVPGVRRAAALVLVPIARAVRRGASPDELTRLLDARVFEALERLRARLWLLATVGSIAPFVGLFGTVVGIMRSFHAIAATGSGGFAIVAAGISEALVATALGLGVAVVAVAFYNYFEARLERIEGALRIASDHLMEAAPAALAA
ncbi:MAG TPA: MotA/TolQ/ExbB proton channel family protein [Candidatus Binatia bacterium]|nr:MotA/TolQ/ExbB proton channel family protein [Candidatus Binatia bacterium]